jgi:predicted Zn-dependent protease
VRCILLALALLAVAACETVPVTGRSQLLLVSEGEETKMGIDAYQGILKKSKVSSDSRLNEQVMRVGQRIAAATGRNDYQWEFKVLEDAQANAFCLPGGKVAVYTGIVPITRDDPRARRGAGSRSLARDRASRWPAHEPDARGPDRSRRDADRAGRQRDLWVRMGEASRGWLDAPAFLSTHPSAATRVTQIEAWIPGALEYYHPR